jgi:hypothetical protein
VFAARRPAHAAAVAVVALVALAALAVVCGSGRREQQRSVG